MNVTPRLFFIPVRLSESRKRVRARQVVESSVKLLRRSSERRHGEQQQQRTRMMFKILCDVVRLSAAHGWQEMALLGGKQSQLVWIGWLWFLWLCCLAEIVWIDSVPGAVGFSGTADEAARGREGTLAHWMSYEVWHSVGVRCRNDLFPVSRLLTEQSGHLSVRRVSSFISAQCY